MKHVSEQGLTLPAGEVRVGPRVIATIVRRAIGATEGVAGLSEAPEALRILETPSGMAMEVAAVFHYGAAIEPAAQALQARIAHDLAHALGRNVAHVRVHVQGTRRS
jgi:uncharacterized alkaline shock family protein YloU